MASKVEITQQTADKKNHFEEEVQRISGYITMLTTTVTQLSTLIQRGATVVKGAKDDIQRVAGTVKNSINTTINTAKGAVDSAKNTLTNSVKDIGRSVNNIPNQALSVDALGSINSSLGRGISIKDVPGQIFNAIPKVGMSGVMTVSAGPGDLINSVHRLGADAFNLSNRATSFIENNQVIQTIIPSKYVDKISEKELSRQLRLYQAELDRYKKVAQEWIQTNTQAITTWIQNTQKSIKSQIDKQIQAKINAISVFAGVDPETFSALLDSAVSTAKSHIKKEPDSKDKLKSLLYTSGAAFASRGPTTKSLAEAAIGASEAYNMTKNTIKTIPKIRL